MSSEFDQENLLSIFVTEASDGMTALAKALMPDDGGLPTQRQLQDQFITAHRIKGAAALYGYNGVANLCEQLEALCERATAVPEDRWPVVVGAMRKIVQTIQDVVFAIGHGGSEDVTLVEQCLFSTSDLLSDNKNTGGSLAEFELLDYEYVSPEIEDAVLAYFVSEAEEYLVVIESVLPGLREDSGTDSILHLLSLTTHALTVAAFTIEFHIISDIARRMEACVSAAQERRVALGGEFLDALMLAVSSIRTLMRRDAAAMGRLRSDVPALLETLERIVNGDRDVMRSFSARPPTSLSEGEESRILDIHVATGSREDGHLFPEVIISGTIGERQVPESGMSPEVSEEPWLRDPVMEEVGDGHIAPVTVADGASVGEVIDVETVGGVEVAGQVISGVGAEDSSVQTASESTMPVLSSEYILPALDEVALVNFGTEAEELLAEMEGLIQIISLDASGDTTRYFMDAVHTLKDLADDIGFLVVSDIAQNMEACLVAVQEQDIPVNSELLDAAVYAISLVRVLLRRDATVVETLRSDVSGLIEILRRLCDRPADDALSTSVSKEAGSSSDVTAGMLSRSVAEPGESSFVVLKDGGEGPAGAPAASGASVEESVAPWLRDPVVEEAGDGRIAPVTVEDETPFANRIGPEESPAGAPAASAASVEESVAPWLRDPVVEEAGDGGLAPVALREEPSFTDTMAPEESPAGALTVSAASVEESVAPWLRDPVVEEAGDGGLAPVTVSEESSRLEIEYIALYAGAERPNLADSSDTNSEQQPPAVSESSISPASAEYVMPAVDEEVLSYFVPEAEEYLAAIEELVPVLRDAPADDDAIYRLFRATHTLKGSAYTVEFQVIGDIAHPMEDCMIAVREQRIALSQELLDVFMYAAALVRQVLQREASAVTRLQNDIPPLIAILRGLCDGQTGMEAATLLSVPDSTPAGVATGASAIPVEDIPAFQSEDYFVPELDPEVLSYFVPEAEEYLEKLEADLLRLDKDPQNKELIDQLFRTAHTLKGSAYTVGFQAIGDLVHHVEDFMGAVRDHRLCVMPGHTDLILRAVDVVHILMRRDPSVLESTKIRFQASLSELKQLEQGHVIEAESTGQFTDKTDLQGERLPLVEEDEGLPGKQAEGRTGEERDVIRVSYARLERLMNLVGELVIGRGRLEQRLRMLERLSDQVLACKVRMTESIQSFSEKHTFTFQSASSNTETSVMPQGVRGFEDFGGLELDKYDDFNILARRIGEVSADITEAMAQLSGSIGRAQEDMSSLQQLTRVMRDEIGRARMVPIGTPFTRFRRAIRESARSLDKQVSLVTSGEHTEVDTGIVEGLVDPLVHLVRNAVYHGIEAPAERVAKGKPPVGTIYLHAAHRGNSVVIEIEDDGAGLNLEKIRNKAAAVGLLRREQVRTLPDSEALQFIFAPGFSTAEKVGDQAGRGVGLDVVKRAIENMNGHIEVESEPGIGTKFTLSLPLTLLITTALLVRSGNERYAIALSNIREVTLPAAISLEHTDDRTLLRMEEEVIEVQSLRRILHRESASMNAGMPIVIVRMSTGVLGLAVDELLGRQEIVIKTLGSLKPLTHSCFAGATIDPEGRVILVLDPSRLDIRHPARPGSFGVPASGIASPPIAVEDASGSSNAVILLIDDSLSIRKFVGRMLESAGYPVDTAVDGDDGIRKASEKAYRLVITDLEMPKFNGYEVVQALRARPQTQQTPIVVMTTRAGEKHRQLAFDVGANSYIAKPVDERTLLDEVERWVGTTPADRT